MCNASFQLRPANLYFIIIYIIGKNNNLVYLGFVNQYFQLDIKFKVNISCNHTRDDECQFTMQIY